MTKVIFSLREMLLLKCLKGKQMPKALKLDRAYPHARYDELLGKVQAQIESLSLHKGGEYAGDQYRLANFRRNARDSGVPAEVVWRIYAGKHWDAISQYIRDIADGKDRPRSEHIQGRAYDLIVYLILFLAMEDEKALYSN